ncbi:MAG: sugar phosphate nucleotidyltransferase [Vulcanimicrobiota bacterium]
MKAMILAAGGGTRLYPLTFSLPKPMAPVMNRPVMEHIIEHLKQHNFNEIMVNLHNFPHSIENYFKNGKDFGVRMKYSHETELLGTAGGVKKVERFFDDTFLVTGGDDLHDIDLTALVNFHKEKNALATIGLSPVEQVQHYGVVVTDNEGKILEFQEKPDPEEAKSKWVNNGLYIFEPQVLEMIPPNTFYDFGSELFPLLKEQGAPFYGFKTHDYWKDIGNLVEYRKAHFDCLKNKVCVNFPGEEIRPDIWVEEDVDLPEDIEIKPPVLIGKQCKFGKNVKLHGPLVMGKYNVIDDNTKVIRSIMWDFNHIRKNSRIVDCLIGDECMLDGGSDYEETVLGSEMKYVFNDYFRHKRMVVSCKNS